MGRGSQHAEVELRNARNAVRFFSCASAQFHTLQRNRDRVREVHYVLIVSYGTYYHRRISVDPEEHLFVILLILKRNRYNATVILFNRICC